MEQRPKLDNNIHFKIYKYFVETCNNYKNGA